MVSKYRYECASEAGLIQQLAVQYVACGGHRYWVAGTVKPGRDPRTHDEKMMALYDVRSSPSQRYRRKLAGRANLHYLRHADFWILTSTTGEHEFFDREAAVIRDIRRHPVQFAGYSIGFKRGADRKWHASVRLQAERYLELKAELVEVSTKVSERKLRGRFWNHGLLAYAPVRRQLLNVLRAANRKRAQAGLSQLPPDCIRFKREVVKPFLESAPEIQGYLDPSAPRETSGESFSRSRIRSDVALSTDFGQNASQEA